MDLRNDWLAGGDVARSAQTAYTVRVERIPRAFRSPAILQKFFSTLFPGQVRFVSFVLCFFCAYGNAWSSQRNPAPAVVTQYRAHRLTHWLRHVSLLIRMGGWGHRVCVTTATCSVPTPLPPPPPHLDDCQCSTTSLQRQEHRFGAVSENRVTAVEPIIISRRQLSRDVLYIDKRHDLFGVWCWQPVTLFGVVQ